MSKDIELDNIVLRKLIESDVPQILDIWRENNLYEGLYTIQTFATCDPDGFYVAYDLNEVIGACAGPKSNENIAFIGLYCIHKDYQGLGLGLKLFKKIREHLGDDINIGLGAVPSQINTYKEKAGFQVEDIHRMVVFEGKAYGSEQLTQEIDGIFVQPINDTITERVIEYDAGITKYRRDQILRLTFNEPMSIAMAAIRIADDTIAGFGCLKSSNIDEVINGPLYADTSSIAELLMHNLLHSFHSALENGLIYFALNGTPDSSKLAEKLGLIRKEEVPRLFTKAIPDADVSRIYSILTPNFSPF
ncbi:hypothetical protein B4U79_16240 [Dinothrombium tinctorium]|uniref:N-acetyltransferase domain-containing protein n=1 Tax=Dinothrombium tinctorium TaxID=1965070 RepID=A0A3S3PQ41_9ACAR|nr:hypothetical protein B4U79_16325 [Dinothrombium tinctorium]RWS06036.1 hypothetical protein B4U79_16254 [Dinothrombium tinctorium]RWS06154.1 hypothetical protein B4U79_16240 [Dinothrombium tinctorium]